MARKPQVRYFASRQAFYCQHMGKQHKLASGPDDSPYGPTYHAALDAFQHLMRLGNVPIARDRNTVRVILETYLQGIVGKRRDSTFERRRHAFTFFCASFGEIAVGDLTPFMIEQFVTQMRLPRDTNVNDGRKCSWGDASVTICLDGLHAAFRWAAKKKLITVNPLDGVDRPERRSRSRKCLVSDDQHARILAACGKRNFRNVVFALHATGARPGEIAAATAKDWNEDVRAIVYYGDDRRREDEFRHKTAGKKKDRVIFFTGEALDMMRELMKRHPTGPLFRTQRNARWNTMSISSVFMTFREIVGMPDLIPYSYRHTFATRWLLAGKSIDILAELLGNSPQTIRRHYSHLCGDRQAVRRQLEEFMMEVGTGTPTASPVEPMT